jgi:hypothetical protein
VSYLGLNSTQWTAIAAIATVVLAIGAVITSIFAIRAFGKQSAELGVLQQQAKDQADQLEIQRRQADDQRKVNEKQTVVLELQATELSESLAERKRGAEEQRREQASQVATWFGLGEAYSRGTEVGHPVQEWGAFIRNESVLPVLSARVFFHYIQAESAVAEAWQPVMRGGPIDRIRVIPPRSEQFVEIPHSVRKMIDQCDDSVYVVSVEFTDAAGNRWERDPYGALKAPRWRRRRPHQLILSLAEPSAAHGWLTDGYRLEPGLPRGFEEASGSGPGLAASPRLLAP